MPGTTDRGRWDSLAERIYVNRWNLYAGTAIGLYLFRERGAIVLGIWAAQLALFAIWAYRLAQRTGYPPAAAALAGALGLGAVPVLFMTAFPRRASFRPLVRVAAALVLLTMAVALALIVRDGAGS